jgi:hypothetical protein
VSGVGVDGTQSLCGGVVGDPAAGQPARGGGDRGVPPRRARAFGARDASQSHHDDAGGNLYGWPLSGVGIEPVSHSIVLEQAAQARAHDTWPALMAPALAGRTGQGIQSTSDEAPGRLASVEQHLGAQHAPDLFHGQHAGIVKLLRWKRA